MTTTLEPQQQRAELRTRNRIGIVICALLGVADVASLLALTGSDSGDSGDSVGPPAAVLVFAALLGVLTLAAVVVTWRSGSPRAARIVAGTRILSALTSLPAFFVDDVSGGLIALTGLGIVLTLVGVWLLLDRPSTAGGPPSA